MNLKLTIDLLPRGAWGTNLKMIGLDKHAKEHFMRVNECDLKTLASEQQLAHAIN